MSLLLLACAPEPAPDTCTTCTLGDVQNYRYAADLHAEVVPIAALTDITVDWSALSVDIQGHAVAAGEVTHAQLVAFRGLSPEEVAAGLASDDLDQVAVTLFLTCTSDRGTCSLSEFSILGSSVDASDYTEAGVATWLVALGRPDTPGAASLIFLAPEETSANVRVDVTDTSAALDVDVDFEALTPVFVPADDPSVTVDWSTLMTDGIGNAVDLDGIDEVFVARYDTDLVTLEGRVFDLLTMSADTWKADVTGVRSVALADLQGPRPFPGVDAGATWLLALTCSTCTNPAPRFVTVLSAP